MNITKVSKSEITQSREVPGLLDCTIKYEIKSARGALDYKGPKFDARMWHQVLSFFRWTNTEHRSESQVRLYVNSRLNRWGAWAFPQKARTGLTATELDLKETPEQAVERFGSWGSAPSDDWQYLGTAHHHCEAGAFQSGTDSANEIKQAGIHLTVGRMNEKRHDLHARFYLDENCYEVDLSRFWDVGDGVRGLVPEKMHDEIARFQMTELLEVAFPEQWRNNLIEVKSVKPSWRLDDALERSYAHYSGQGHSAPVKFDLDRAIEQIRNQAATWQVTDEELSEALSYLDDEPAARLIVEACLDHDVKPEEVIAELDRQNLEAANPPANHGSLLEDRPQPIAENKSIHELTEEELMHQAYLGDY